MEFELAPAALESIELDGQELEVSCLSATIAEGKLEGHARLVLKSGCVYEGNMEASRMHGQGKVVFPDGMQFEGTFQNNCIHGNGVFNWPGGAVYTGEVANGLRHGQGRMSFSDSPVVYEGGWQHGKRHGHGKITLNAEGTHWYQGDWEDDRKCGQGVMHYDNGNQYTGAWAGDVKCGHGVMEWTSKKQKYEGSWAHNLPNGSGTHIWFKQLVSEPSPANHAMLMLFNRYEGHFRDGLRSGYGVLYYATGARYEGCWEQDLKQGPGVFVFENGEAWHGEFYEDHPLLAEDETFAPKGPGICIQVEDLVDEEEVVAAAARGLANVLMVYNTDLRSLYDKYCKRPSLHLKGKTRPCFTMVTCQVWELLGDVRLITAATPLARCNQLLAQARRPPAAVDSFRRAMRAAMCDTSDHVDVAWWDALASEHVREGVHAPMQELLFREFCEFLVRLASVRYKHVPLLERRLHTLINVHLLHQVSKTKATLPPPPRTPFHLEMWAGNATSVLHASDALLRAAWARIGSPDQQPKPLPSVNSSRAASQSGTQPGDMRDEEDQAQDMTEPELVPDVKIHASFGPVLSDGELYGDVHTVRQALQLLQKLGLLSSPAVAMQAAAAMTFNYLTINTYTYEPQRPRVEMEGNLGDVGAPSESGAPTGNPPEAAAGEQGPNGDCQGGVAELADSDTREVLCWLDQPLVYADWVEGLARVAQVLAAPTTMAMVEAEASAGKEAAGFLGNDGEENPPPSPGGEGALHRQLRAFLTGPAGLQQALLMAGAARQSE